MSEIESVTASRLTRRTVLQVGCTAAMAVAAGPALAQQPAGPAPRVKGPRVWRALKERSSAL